MSKINNDEIKMRSKSFFVLLKALGEVLSLSLVILIIYLVNLSFYLPKRDFPPGGGVGRMKPQGPLPILRFIPWQYIIVSIVLFSLVVWLIYKYTNFYKKKPLLWIAILFAIIVAFGYFTTLSGINQRLEHRKELEPFYRGRGPNIQAQGFNLHQSPINIRFPEL